MESVGAIETFQAGSTHGPVDPEERRVSSLSQTRERRQRQSLGQSRAEEKAHHSKAKQSKSKQVWSDEYGRHRLEEGSAAAKSGELLPALSEIRLQQGRSRCRGGGALAWEMRIDLYQLISVLNFP